MFWDVLKQTAKGIDGFFDKYIIINMVPYFVRYTLCLAMLLGPCVLLVAIMCSNEDDDEEEEETANKDGKQVADERKNKDSKEVSKEDSKKGEQKKGSKKVQREKIE